MRTLSTLTACLLLVFAVAADEPAKNDAVARRLLFKDGPSSPEQIAKLADFTKEYLLSFQWTGSGDDKLSFEIEKDDAGPVVVFRFTGGKLKNKQIHSELYAIAKNATWRFPKNDRVPQPRKITRAEDVAQGPADNSWARITEDDDRIRIETDKLEAVIPKKNPKQWMTGIEKGSFLDKTTGFREVGDGLMVVDWLMEAGSDEAWSDKVIAPDGHGVGRYTWHANETDPARRDYALMAHGQSHRKRMVEGPQLCHRMKPVTPEVIRGKDFIAVKTTYRFEYAAPGRKAGSRWTQLIVFPKGERFFVLMDKIDSINDSDEMFLRNDTPGCVRHVKGDTFSEIYLSYLSGPKGLRIPASEFFTPFPPDLKFGYRRDTHKTPEHFIRAYHLQDKKTGKDGPWLAGLTLQPSVVYEAWASQRPGGIIVMIQEVHGKRVKAGDSFSAAHIVGYFDTIEEMHALNERYKGHTAVSADETGWRLVK